MIIIVNDDHLYEPYNIILYIDDPSMDAWTYDPLQHTWIDAIFKITISHWSPLMFPNNSLLLKGKKQGFLKGLPKKSLPLVGQTPGSAILMKPPCPWRDFAVFRLVNLISAPYENLRLPSNGLSFTPVRKLCIFRLNCKQIFGAPYFFIFFFAFHATLLTQNKNNARQPLMFHILRSDHVFILFNNTVFEDFSDSPSTLVI